MINNFSLILAQMGFNSPTCKNIPRMAYLLNITRNCKLEMIVGGKRNFLDLREILPNICLYSGAASIRGTSESDDKLYYKMDHTHRGTAIIFNHYKYQFNVSPKSTSYCTVNSKKDSQTISFAVQTLSTAILHKRGNSS